MKASAGTAVSGRGAAASRHAAPHRAATKPAARAAPAAIAKKSAPAPVKHARPAQSKAAAHTKTPPPAKPMADKPVPVKQVARAPVAHAAASAATKSAPPKAPPGLVQVATRKSPALPPRPVTAPPIAAPVPQPPAERRPAMPDRPPPRPPAKAETFVEGDHVVYPTHGVGKVERIATEEIAGHRLELIHITFEENRMTLRVPVAKARSAGLRKLATRKLFDDALTVLKGRARIKRTMWSRRAQEYEAKINSGDPLAIAEVVRDLHRNAGQPDQSFSERQIYEAAMDRLAAELAALDKTDRATATTKLANFLKTV
jgi:CarD family transcriptional regulator, regulator of rRNA transcription